VMEVAHANLSPAPLPGYLDEQPGSDDPYMVSQDDTMNYQGDEEFATPRRKRGFFERLFGSNDEPPPQRRKKRQADGENNSIY